MIALSRAQRWGKVIVPSLIPGAMLGVRVAASLAVISALLVASSASTHRRPGGCWSSSGSLAM
jgi:ABC-type nitrate/sulfonate/bicarbonate transport system permease component